MKDIPIEELAAISADIHAAALKVGCTHVSVSGRIWPGASASGAPELAARFVEYSWLRAAVLNGEAIFEEADPKRFLDLLIAYGLEDNPHAQPLRTVARASDESECHAAPHSEKVSFTVELSAITRDALQRRATAAGMSVGEFLEAVFGDRG
jgi:hypothetical protein